MKINLTTIDDARQPLIKELLDKLHVVKKEAVEKGDEDLANNCWREIQAIELNVRYIEAFANLKAHKYRDAWNDLEHCEISRRFIEKNSSGEFFANSRARFIKDKVSQWQSLYPYCVFVSPGFVVSYYTCSICGHKIRPRSRCDHIKGKIYNGELCVHVANDMQVRELSIVRNPVQKYSVIHNDETLDFSLINYVSDLLDNAFEDWEVNWTRRSFPIEKFSNVDPRAQCPCQSGKPFEDCCINKNEVEIPHVDFIFSKNIPEEKTGIRFPY
jgi:hypothetical protein